jgi:predicted amidohydrolase YtcJ
LFADAHAHVIENGFKMQLQLDKAKSVGDVVDSVKEYIHSHPDVERNQSRWIGGMGWDQTKWSGGQFPTAVCPVAVGFSYQYLTSRRVG